MQKEFTEQFTDLCRNANKPFVELAELNYKTFNSTMSKCNGEVERLMSTRRPEEFIAAQLDLAIKANKEAMCYLQKAFDIFNGATEDFNDNLNKMAHQVTKPKKKEAEKK